LRGKRKSSQPDPLCKATSSHGSSRDSRPSVHESS
jgi:hypothetical protein